MIQIGPVPSAHRSQEPATTLPGRLDLLLINPNSRARVYQSLASDLAAVEPPVWIGLIATFIRDRGYSVKILDAEAEGIGSDGVADRVRRLNPRLAAVIVYGQQPSASTQNMTAAGEVCKAIKRLTPRQPLLMGGLHPSALPERTMQEESVDFVCQGEGPYTLLGLLRQPEWKGPVDYSQVNGLWYRKQGVICSTPQAPVIEDLDTDLRAVAWDLLPMDKYRAHNWHCFGHIGDRKPYASMYTSLGCPFKCSFCCINTPFGKPMIRYRSPESVIREIDELVTKYGVRNIKMADEMFILNERQVLGICDRIIERTALQPVAGRLLSHLSKGYKQRVGLAQAMIHDPEVLVLDEPTIGLDPRQIIEIRGLIKDLSGNRTVILSTHILPEVSQVCDKVVIINHGRIACEDTLANLTRDASLEEVFLRYIARDAEALVESGIGAPPPMGA